MSSAPKNESPASDTSASSDAVPVKKRSAVNARNLSVIAVGIVSCVACDQVTKRMATEQLAGQPQQTYWGDFFRLTYVENRGAFLGLGNDWPDSLRWLAFNAGAFVIVAVCAYYIWSTLKREGRLSLPVWALVLIGAGGIGNLIDRLAREGAVIDFMNMGIGWLRTGIFNVADVHIMVGLGMLLLPRRQHAQPAERDSSNGSAAVHGPESSSAAPAPEESLSKEPGNPAATPGG